MINVRRILALTALFALFGRFGLGQSAGINTVTVPTTATPTLTTNAGYTIFIWTLSTTVTSSTFSSAAIGAGALKLCENGTGGFPSPAFPSNFQNFKPLKNTSANACQYYTWEYDGTNVYATGDLMTELGNASSAGGSALTQGYSNDSSTGTTAGLLVKVNGSTQVVTLAGSDTDKAIGICSAGCGTSGTAQIAIAGAPACTFDGATTLGDWVQISSTAGECHDTGSSTFPTSGGQVLGVVLSTNGSGGTYNIAWQARTPAGSGGGGPTASCSGTSVGTEYYCIVTLTSTQVDGMFATPVQLIAAPGSGLIITPYAPIRLTNSFSASYSGGGAIDVGYGSTQANVTTYKATCPNATSLGTCLDFSASVLTDSFTNTLAPGIGTSGSSYTVDYANQPLSISNQSAAFTGGTGSTLKVTIYYVIQAQ